MTAPGPSESFYDDLRTLSLRVKAAWSEAEAFPAAADEVFARLNADVRRIAAVAIMHLRQASSEAEKRWNAAEKATVAAETRIGAALAGVAASQLGDAFDPRGHFVYCLWGVDSRTPLYVGMSSNVLARLGAHLGDSAKRPLIRKVTLLRCKTEKQMKRTETRMIAQFQPPMNTVGVRRPIDEQAVSA